MNELIESIVNKQYTKADELIHEALKNIVDRKLHEVKKMCAAKMSVEQLKVDAQGKFREATGNKKLASIEKAERGLSEIAGNDIDDLKLKYKSMSEEAKKAAKELSARALRFRAALSGEEQPKPTLVKTQKND